MSKIYFKEIVFLFITVFIFLLFSISQAQPVNTGLYEYLSPVPGASKVMPSTSILIRKGEAFQDLANNNLSDIIVTGVKSGIHTGKLKLLEENKILSFSPFTPFKLGETVTVEIKKRIKLANGNYVPYLKYSFQIMEQRVKSKSDEMTFLNEYLTSGKSHTKYSIDNPILLKDSLPSDFPVYSVNNIDPSEGSIFFSPFGWHVQAYLIITDNYGIPVYYQKMPATSFDFQKQINGNLTYFESASGAYYEMNSMYQIVDTLKMVNGYSSDVHELRILENGHSVMFAYDRQVVRMDTIVTGGNPHAVVTGLVLQELDENKNLVFQWRSWDHYKITDATYDISLTDSLIDYVHGNAVAIDYDGNFLLSCRHMDEITKINRITGDIIWRWGGINCKNNEFTFINDPTGFSHQHCIRRLPNGNYTIFDNGNLHDPQYSRAVEYQMDEGNRIVNLVWENSNDPLTYSAAMGSTQRLSNHNTFIGWGAGNTDISMTEVGPDGSLKLSFSLSDTVFSYRAFKYKWHTELFTSNKDSLLFGIVPVGDSAFVSFNLTNNGTEAIEINSIYNRDSAFSFQQQLPIEVPPLASINLSVKFLPSESGSFKDDLHLRWETEGNRIAQVVHLLGYTDSIYVKVNQVDQLTDFNLSQNYPNPFNPVSKISYRIPKSSMVKLQVFDILGNLITTLVDEEQSAGNYEVEFNGSHLASGIYIYRLSADEFLSVKKMLLLK